MLKAIGNIAEMTRFGGSYMVNKICTSLDAAIFSLWWILSPSEILFNPPPPQADRKDAYEQEELINTDLRNS